MSLHGYVRVARAYSLGVQAQLPKSSCSSALVHATNPSTVMTDREDAFAVVAPCRLTLDARPGRQGAWLAAWLALGQVKLTKGAL